MRRNGQHSVSAAFYFPTVPWYGSLQGGEGAPAQFSPFGYEACAHGSGRSDRQRRHERIATGWFERSRAWALHFASDKPAMKLFPLEPAAPEPAEVVS